MKKALPWILLTASVAFNVLFLVGTFRARRRHGLVRTPEGRARLLADKLDMDAQQRAECMTLEKKVAAERDAFCKKRLAQRETFWAEIVKDQPNDVVLEEFIQSSLSAERRQRFVKYMRELMQMLRPEQRQRAAKLFKSHRRRRFR